MTIYIRPFTRKKKKREYTLSRLETLSQYNLNIILKHLKR